MSEKDKMQSKICGNQIKLYRKQWNNCEATISNYPGLLEQISKYTWTYTSGLHPYLRSSKLNMSLHKFVLAFLYGEKLNIMLANDNIIEHLDNDGLNCSFENLHIVSSDLNKAKAFTLDKTKWDNSIPAYILDVYYSHQHNRYQLQIFLNRDIYFLEHGQIPIEKFTCLFEDFQSLFIDWLYLTKQRPEGLFDISKFHANKVFVKPRPIITITNEEKDHIIIERDGKFYLKIETDDPKRFIFMDHTTFQELEDD